MSSKPLTFRLLHILPIASVIGIAAALPVIAIALDANVSIFLAVEGEETGDGGSNGPDLDFCELSATLETSDLSPPPSCRFAVADWVTDTKSVLSGPQSQRGPPLS